MRIPADRLHHITTVVRDARTAAEKMARMYGITHWQVVDNGPDHLTETVSHGFKMPYTFRTATGAASTNDGPVTFQLVEPHDGWSTYKEWLITRGEGIESVCLAEITPPAYAELVHWLEAQGITVAQSYGIDGVVKRVQLDTRAHLGGFYIELLVAESPAWRDGLRVDEQWDLSASVPAKGPLLPLNAFRHFGVVVRDLMKTIQKWNLLFGHADFRFMNWRKDQSSLVDPFYNGASVDHEYFTTTPSIGHLLTFELIQPTFGPSHYKEDFLVPLGEGIHHLFTGFTTAEEWKRILERIAREDAQVCMGGVLGNGVANFFYLDTRRSLPGYVTEYVHPGPNPARPGAPSRFTPTMVLDLSERA